jgi:hypothetical protein
MTVEIGTVAAQFLFFWENLFRIFGIGSLQFMHLTKLSHKGVSLLTKAEVEVSVSPVRTDSSISACEELLEKRLLILCSF